MCHMFILVHSHIYRIDTTYIWNNVFIWPSNQCASHITYCTNIRTHTNEFIYFEIISLWLWWYYPFHWIVTANTHRIDIHRFIAVASTTPECTGFWCHSQYDYFIFIYVYICNRIYFVYLASRIWHISYIFIRLWLFHIHFMWFLHRPEIKIDSSCKRAAEKRAHIAYWIVLYI